MTEASLIAAVEAAVCKGGFGAVGLSTRARAVGAQWARGGGWISRPTRVPPMPPRSRSWATTPGVGPGWGLRRGPYRRSARTRGGCTATLSVSTSAPINRSTVAAVPTGMRKAGFRGDVTVDRTTGMMRFHLTGRALRFRGFAPRF